MLGSFVGVADYGAFVVAVIVFLLLPGPGNLALISSTTSGGVFGGLGATFGVLVGDQVLLWAAVAGVSALMGAYQTIFQAVQWMGVVYLSWLGIKLLLAKPGSAAVLRIKPRHYFRQALLITLLNPKAIVFYLAFFPLFIDPVQHQGLKTFAVMSLTIAVLTLVYGVAAVMMTALLAARMRANPKISALFEKLAGVLLIGFSIKLAISR